MKLDEASPKLCTFNTPFGRYRFTRLPFGIKSATEVFQNHMCGLFADMEGVKVIVDDLIWGKDDEEHDARLKTSVNKSKRSQSRVQCKEMQN